MANDLDEDDRCERSDLFVKHTVILFLLLFCFSFILIEYYVKNFIFISYYVTLFFINSL